MRSIVIYLFLITLLLSVFISCKSEFDESPVVKSTAPRGPIFGFGQINSLSESDTVYGYIKISAYGRMNRPNLAGTPYSCDLDGGFANGDLEGDNPQFVPAGAFTLGDTIIFPNPNPRSHYQYRNSEYLASLFGTSVSATLQGDSSQHVPAYSFTMDFPELLECEIDTASKSHGIELSWNGSTASIPVMIEVKDLGYDTSWSTFTDDDGYYRIEPSALNPFSVGQLLTVSVTRLAYGHATEVASDGKSKTFLILTYNNPFGSVRLTE